MFMTRCALLHAWIYTRVDATNQSYNLLKIYLDNFFNN